jgi:hypothetical protein
VEIRQAVTAATLSRGSWPGIPMVQSVKPRHGHNPGPSQRSWLYRSPLGRIFVQGIVNSVLMIVTDVITHQPTQVIFIQDDHVVQQFPSAAADPTLRDSLLPRTLVGGSDQLAT